MIDPELVAAAKTEMERLKKQAAIAKLSPEDQELMKRYPRHTLAAARMIDSTPLQRCVPGMRDAFYLIRKQETANFHITDDHT
jgi:hypothetical protein